MNYQRDLVVDLEIYFLWQIVKFDYFLILLFEQILLLCELLMCNFSFPDNIF